MRRLISSGLLVAVLLAPVLGLACASAFTPAKAGCSHCAMKGHGRQAPAPVAPCCGRKAPAPAMNEPSAQIVAPVQIALLPAVAMKATLPSRPTMRVEVAATPPQLAPPLSLLCTLLI